MDKLSYYFEQNLLEQGTANVVHVLNSCDAFEKNGVGVTLYATTRKMTQDSIRGMYGLDAKFSIRRIVRFPYIKVMLNGLGMFCYLMMDDNPVILTRNFYFAYLASRLDKVVILEAHQYAFDQQYHTYFFREILKRIACKPNVVLLTNCGSLKDKFREMGVTAPVMVCHNGYDARKCDTAGVAVDRLGYKAVAMYAGSLNRIKGLGHIEHLAAVNRDVLFYLIGDDHYHADKDIVEKLKTHENVRFTGKIDHQDVHRHISQADILLVLPTVEGVYNDVTSPIKMFEYMSVGKAILATGMPSVKEVLKDGRNALMAEDDKLDVETKFRVLVDDEGLRASLGAAARQDVKMYTWERRAQRIKEYIAARYAGRVVRGSA
ncbi:MAG TPA: glycosyltransferase [Nitrospirota bacterium]